MKITDKTDKCDNTSHGDCPKAKIVAKKRLGKKSSTTYQSSCQHLSAVVDWQICSCFTLQI